MRSFLFLLLLFLISGCVSSGTKVDQNKLAGFQKGKTTYDEVVRELGPPNGSTINSDGSRNISYTYFQSESDPKSFVPIVGALIGSAHSENTTVIILFDRYGVLSSYQATQGGSTLGTGLISGQKQ